MLAGTQLFAALFAYLPSKQHLSSFLLVWMPCKYPCTVSNLCLSFYEAVLRWIVHAGFVTLKIRGNECCVLNHGGACIGTGIDSILSPTRFSVPLLAYSISEPGAISFHVFVNKSGALIIDTLCRRGGCGRSAAGSSMLTSFKFSDSPPAFVATTT